MGICTPQQWFSGPKRKRDGRPKERPKLIEGKPTRIFVYSSSFLPILSQYVDPREPPDTRGAPRPSVRRVRPFVKCQSKDPTLQESLFVLDRPPLSSRHYVSFGTNRRTPTVTVTTTDTRFLSCWTIPQSRTQPPVCVFSWHGRN